MARVFFSDKEAATVIAIIEAFLRNNPQSCQADIVKAVPFRIKICIEKQGKKKVVTRKGND